MLNVIKFPDEEIKKSLYYLVNSTEVKKVEIKDFLQNIVLETTKTVVDEFTCKKIEGIKPRHDYPK